MTIPLVDLASQHAEIADEIRPALERVFATTAFVGGPEVAATCAAPVSSSWTPGVQPARTPPVLAVVRPCRSRITVVTDGA